MRDSEDLRVSRENQPEDSDSLAHVIASANRNELIGLLRDPRLNESSLLILLSRNDLPEALLDAIATRREWMKSQRVCYALASHPRTSRLVALRAMRNLPVMDLCKLALAPAVASANRAAADDVLISRFPQLALGQKISLARQAGTRVLAEFLIAGEARAVAVALESGRLTEASILKVLSKEKLGDATVSAIARHARWSRLANVRMALLQRPELKAENAAQFLKECSVAELKMLSESRKISPTVRDEIARRLSNRI